MWLLLSALLPLAFGGPVVETPYGKVEGFDYEISNGDKANIFLGIPYAQPPVGNLRFEKTVPIAKWDDVKQAKEFGNLCFQQTVRKDMSGPGEYSEDCLFMNIMAPSKKSADPEGYPVIIFIHGGGFELGGSNLYGYKNISENYVSEGVVYITLNYRLSAFGFFSTGDEVIRGNLGYWDQTAALKFIQEVIASFGGNPNKVTVTGESAGGGSSSALTMSPHSNKLFQQAIAYSGSQYANFVNYSQVVNASLDLARSLGCFGKSIQIKDCMKKKTAEEIRAMIAEIGASRDEFNSIKFNPTVDGDFLRAPGDELIKDAPKIPFITGLTDTEGGFCAFYDVPEMLLSYIPREKWPTYSTEDFVKYLKTKMITLDYGNKKETLITKLIDHYVPTGANVTSLDYLTRYAELFTDLYFGLPPYLEAQDKAAADIPVYLYKEDYHNPKLVENLPVKGAYHGYEIMYLMGPSIYGDIEFTDDDKAFQKALLSAFISFAKTGKPVASGKIWEPVTKEHPNRYMSFSPNSEMKDDFLKRAVDFWVHDVMKTVDIDMLRETILPGARRT
ncbi:hypothetical protein QR680_010167 [Steinernema hermaphroditum]|uniref:Carboxylic ester hydrolase n=1 Tax=Steinernema hermaphroditum TaxID=289476 RepID=A0AA39IPN3_9BILA|nr:hypothetical protein QR680_010167 [Steinernema hermaphroditum]